MKLSALLALVGIASAKSYKTNPGGPVFKVLWEPDAKAYEVRADVKKGDKLILFWNKDRNVPSDIVVFDATSTDGKVIDSSGLMGENAQTEDKK